MCVLGSEQCKGYGIVESGGTAVNGYFDSKHIYAGESK